MMVNDINKKNVNIYEIVKKLGLNKKDVNNLLIENECKNEHLSLEAGPEPYWAAMYGAISINDIQFCINFKDYSNNLGG